MTPYYDRARFIVETNADKQARHDANTTPLYKIQEFLNRPTIYLDALEVLHSWARGDNAHVVFTGVAMEDYDNLTDLEREGLVKLWCYLYPSLVLQYLRERVTNDAY